MDHVVIHVDTERPCSQRANAVRHGDTAMVFIVRMFRRIVKTVLDGACTLPANAIPAVFFRRKVRATETAPGFTFLELAIVLVIAGVILSIGAASWMTFMEGRRVAKTRSVLQQAKDCLVRRVVFNERYPGIKDSDSEYPNDFKVCLDDAGNDGWNNEIKCLVGYDSERNTLDGGDFIVTDDARNQTAVDLDYDEIQVFTSQGNQTGVAFVLYSLGSNGQADDTSYGGADRIQPIADLEDTPDFTPPDDPDDDFDDIFLVVKSYELIAAIKNAVGR